MQYLAAIENKTSEILTAINGDYEDQGNSRPGSGSSSRPSSGSPTGSRGSDNNKGAIVDVPLPSATTGEFSGDDEDEGERPFTMAELQESVYAL